MDGSPNSSKYKLKMKKPVPELFAPSTKSECESLKSVQTENDKHSEKNAVTREENSSETNQIIPFADPVNVDVKFSTFSKPRRKKPVSKKNAVAKGKETNTETEKFGHVLLARMTELWKQIHKLDLEILNPIHSKVCPFNKNHFNVQIFWYLVSSLLFPKNLSKINIDTDKVVQKIAATYNRENSTFSILSKFKHGENKDVLTKSVQNFCLEALNKPKSKTITSKKNRNFKNLEFLLRYLMFKLSIKNFCDRIFFADEKNAEEKIISTLFLENKRLLKNLKNCPDSSSGDEFQKSTIVSTPEAKEFQQSSQKIGQTEAISIDDCIKLAINNKSSGEQNYELVSNKSKNVSNLQISEIIKKFENERKSNKNRIAKLLQTTELRKKQLDLKNHIFERQIIKKSKKDTLNLFVNTVRESDVLFHTRSFYKIDEKYLRKIEDNFKSASKMHDSAGNKISLITRHAIRETRLFYRGRRMPNL